MGKKKNNSHCLYGMMCSFLVLVSLVIFVSLYKDYKHRQIYNNVDTSQRRNYHKSAYKTMLSQSPTVKHGGVHRPSVEEKIVRPQFYDSASVRELVQVNLTKFAGPVQGQVRVVRLADDYLPSTASPSMTMGMKTRITTGARVASFVGIPYAQPPVGARQFEQAKVSSAWKTPFDATRAPSKCPQDAHFFSAISDMNSVDESESEDCLYLNIWTPYESIVGRNRSHRPAPETANNKLGINKKPVLVYFHSGLFSFGTISSHDFDPSKLVAREDIVVITVQYRLGALGFASFDSDSALYQTPSSRPDYRHTSLAISDQARALEWIQANIGNFGGDARQVTLAGHGAGAITVGAHLLNSGTNRLFHKVILQGYQNLLNIGIYGMNDRAAKTLSEELGCATEANNSSLASLKKCSQKSKAKPSSIVEYQHFMFAKHPVPFGPEFNPYTGELIDKLRTNATLFADGEKPSVSELVQLFQNWNLFPKHIQFLIGLNSDDDYKFESTNRQNTGIHFDEEEEEEEEPEKEEETGSQTSGGESNADPQTKNSNRMIQSDRSKMPNPESKADKSAKVVAVDDDHAQGSDDESDKDAGNDEDVEDESEDGEEDEDHERSTTLENNGKADKSNDNDQEREISIPKSSNVNGETTTAPSNGVNADEDDEDEITTIPPKMAPQQSKFSSTDKREMPKPKASGRLRRSLLSLSRQRRNTPESTPSSGSSDSKLVHLEEDEIAKLCKLTQFYRALKGKDSSDSVSDQVTIYRIDPRVLQSPLEEVPLVFGAKTKKWLTGFDQHITELWASFVKSDKISGLDDGESQLAQLGLDSVRFINLGQKDAPADDSVAPPSDKEPQHSSFGWNTFTDLTSHCQSI